MICNSFNELNVVQKVEFIGKLTHIVQSYEGAFNEAVKMIERADKDGLFDNVKILPEVNQESL